MLSVVCVKLKVLRAAPWLTAEVSSVTWQWTGRSWNHFNKSNQHGPVGYSPFPSILPLNVLGLAADFYTLVLKTRPQFHSPAVLMICVDHHCCFCYLFLNLFPVYHKPVYPLSHLWKKVQMSGVMLWDLNLTLDLKLLEHDLAAKFQTRPQHHDFTGKNKESRFVL